MPSVMLRRNENGQISFYVPKKDLEETIVSLEFDQDDKWGGQVELADGSLFYLEPMDARPTLPLTVRAKRL
jgi:nitrogen fixation protein NifT